MKRFDIRFTREEIIEYFKLNLTSAERLALPVDETIKMHDDGFWATLWRRLFPSKLFAIKFEDGSVFFLKGENEADVLLGIFPTISNNIHRCSGMTYNENCEKCRTTLDKLVHQLNTAKVSWIGLARPDDNWVQGI